MPTTKKKVRFQPRLWIEDFRIEDTRENRMILRMMEDWKAERKRPAHFVKAMLLYKTLTEGDIDLFLELLIDIAPRAALKLIQRIDIGGGAKVDAPAKEPRSRKEQAEIPVIEYTEQTSEEKIDALADSLGLNDLEF